LLGLSKSFKSLVERVEERTEELQLAKKQAEAANKTKSAFNSSMGHELRTTLNAVLGFSHIIKSSADATPSQVENLDIITRSGEHLLNLINNVLDLSKIESGRIELEESDTFLFQLLEEVKSLMNVRSQERGLELNLE
jgi:signal transduction histidine kinase